MYTKSEEKGAKRAGKLQYAVTGHAHDGGTYSCDKVQQVFRLRFGEGQRLLDEMARAGWVEFEHWESRRPGTYRNQFRVLLEGERSFWLGVGLNQYGKAKPTDGCKLEYNPNKVWGERALHWLLAQCWDRSSVVEPCRLKAWDLAVDWPEPRERYRLRKDARVYEERTASATDCTQYVGQRNAPGRCKLYNKQLEAGLADACTRLEITLDGATRAQDVPQVWPVVYRLGDYQTTAESARLTDTDRFILLTLLDAPDRVRELGRRKAQRMQALLDDARRRVEFDPKAFAPVAAFVEKLKLPPQDRKAGVPRWEWHGQPDGWIHPDKDPWKAARCVAGLAVDNFGKGDSAENGA